jgi:hypothetical protein
MRHAPLNYLITIVLGCLIWAVTGIVVGNYLGDTVVLQVVTTDDFLATYRTTLAVAALLGVLGCLYWYYYGSKETTAARLGEARRSWTVSFVTQVVVAALALVAIVVTFRREALTTGDYALIFLMLALQTFLFYWVCTFLMSPRSVEYIPWGKR